MQFSTYHILLRVSALTLAFVLLFESGILNPVTKDISDGTRGYLASVIGVNVAVSPTELNTITAKLTEQQVILDERESSITEREIAVGLRSGSSPQQSSGMSTFILSAVLFILLVLIVLNYALDYVRNRRTGNVTTA